MTRGTLLRSTIAAALLGLVLLLGAGAASAQVTDGYSGNDGTTVDNGSGAGTGSGTLPRTGSDDALLLTAVGVSAVALGAGVVLVAGRMRKAEVAA